jgi:hypothetical protein
MRARPVVAVALLVCWTLAGTVAFTGSAAAATIEVDHTLGQNDAAGEVDVRTDVAIPSGAASFEITLPEGTEVYESRGFTQTGSRTYEWTKTTNEPYLRYSMQGNVTVDRGDGPKYLYAVSDDWAVVRTPSTSLGWTGVQADVDVSVHAAGEGVAGRHIVYLGPYESTTRQATDQRFRLIEAGAADLRADRDAVLDTLEYTSDRLQIGTKDEEVRVFVVPSDGIDWGATGVQRGDADLWVRDVERLDRPKNTWVHEYVHTLQDYERTKETRWTTEGMADYYAALISYEQGHVDYETFRDRMTEGRGGDVRLVDPSTWEDTQGNYDKGALVFGHLDRRLRTEHDSSIDAVIAQLNADGEELTHGAFLDAVESAGDADLRADAERYTETTDAPQVWSRSEHVRAFGGPALEYGFESFAASGPYRNGTLAEPRLVAGETLTTTVSVENVGTQGADYEAALAVDGGTVESSTGTLPAGESTTVTLEHTVESAGEYELSVGRASTTAVVEEPAGVEVTGLEVEPTRAAQGEQVTLRATVESTAGRPAAGDVAVAVDGETVATEPVRMAGGSTTVEATTTFESAGEYELTAGGQSASLTVTDETVTPTPTANGAGGGTTIVGDGPGLGAAPAVVALAVAALFYRRR